MLFPVSIGVLLFLTFYSITENNLSAGEEVDFMNGVSFVAPPREFDSDPFSNLKELNADWVAIMPYAFLDPADPVIRFDEKQQWWGERTEGVIKSIELAKANGMTERDVWEGTDYYKTSRGQKPGGATKMLFSHAQNTLCWDAFGYTELLMTQPMMVVIGQKVGAFGAYRDGMEVYGRATASKDRQLVEMKEWSHYDIYDQDEPVSLALVQMVPFLKKHVGGEDSKVHAAA